MPDFYKRNRGVRPPKYMHPKKRRFSMMQNDIAKKRHLRNSARTGAHYAL